jgi:hypothetical protein
MSCMAISGVLSRAVKAESSGVVGIAPGGLGVGMSLLVRLLVGRRLYLEVVTVMLDSGCMVDVLGANSLPEVGQT